MPVLCQVVPFYVAWPYYRDIQIQLYSPETVIEGALENVSNLSYASLAECVSSLRYNLSNFSSKFLTPLSSLLSDLDYHQFHNNPTQCECNTSSHLYQPYGHVITGDLSIIPNSKLRDLIAKGPQYREPCKVDWDKNLSLCVKLLTSMHCNGLNEKW